MRLLSLLAPPLCAACGAAGERAEPLCGSCRARLTWLGPLPVVLNGLRTWAPVAYAGPARELVRALKFGGARRAAETMAAQMAANAPPDLLPARTGRPNAPNRRLRPTTPVLVPVPIHPRRLRRRGYDQAALLAEALAQRTGLPVTRCLKRSGSAGAQVGRGRSERMTGPPGEITAAGTPPPHALLVDDVLTTGATLAACARALRAAGAETVAALAYARTPGR